MKPDIIKKHEYIGLLPDYEQKHMVRVGLSVEALAAKLAGIDCFYAKLLGEASFYHDIGKLYIPVNLLLKKGALTTAERNIMKMHTFCGQFALKEIRCESAFLEENFQLAMNAALYHHERWDGCGYPFGLRAEQIPLIGRLTAICDTYDAITSCRPYSRNKQHKQACQELEKCSGTQFDPDLVSLFLHYDLEMEACANDFRVIEKSG